MAKVTIEICDICKQGECDGKEFKTECLRGSYDSDHWVEKVCRNHPDVEKIDGRLMYKFVRGHGDYHHFYIFPIEYSDERVEEEAKKLRAEEEIKDKEREKAREEMFKKLRKVKYEELKKEFGE